MDGDVTTVKERAWRTIAGALLCVLLWQMTWLPGPPPTLEAERWGVEEASVGSDDEPRATTGPRVQQPPPHVPLMESTPHPPPPPTRQVGNTDGDGVYLRATPRLEDRLRAWPEGAPMRPTGNEAEGEGLRWIEVIDPDGTRGWVPDRYLR